MSRFIHISLRSIRDLVGIVPSRKYSLLVVQPSSLVPVGIIPDDSHTKAVIIPSFGGLRLGVSMFFMA